MYESSGSQFFRTTTEIQSRPDTFDESRFIMTFLTIIEITQIYTMQFHKPESSRLQFLEKFLANKCALSDGESNSSRLLNREGIADLPLLRTLLAICQKPQKPSFWEVIDSFVSLAYASLAASRTLLQGLLACLNFRFRRFILLVQMKKVISMNYDSSTSCWKPWWWVRLDMIRRWGILLYTSILTWIYSQNSLAAAEAPNLKIFSHGTSLKWSHLILITSQHPVLSLMESQWKLRQQHDQNFPMKGKPL